MQESYALSQHTYYAEDNTRIESGAGKEVLLILNIRRVKPHGEKVE
jgi:hypothetical protein